MLYYTKFSNGSFPDALFNAFQKNEGITDRLKKEKKLSIEK